MCILKPHCPISRLLLASYYSGSLYSSSGKRKIIGCSRIQCFWVWCLLREELENLLENGMCFLKFFSPPLKSVVVDSLICRWFQDSHHPKGRLFFVQCKANPRDVLVTLGAIAVQILAICPQFVSNEFDIKVFILSYVTLLNITGCIPSFIF